MPQKTNKKLLYLSPFTSKITMVLDQRLANQGAFGVKNMMRRKI
jgi:hypothetical protein